jgi:hypothetical protein
MEYQINQAKKEMLRVVHLPRTGDDLRAPEATAHVWLPGKLENRYYSRQFGSHLGNVG